MLVQEVCSSRTQHLDSRKHLLVFLLSRLCGAGFFFLLPNAEPPHSLSSKRIVVRPLVLVWVLSAYLHVLQLVPDVLQVCYNDLH